MAAASDNAEVTGAPHALRVIGSRLARPFAWFGAARGAALLFLVLLIGVRAWDPGPVELVRLKAFDFYQQLAPRTGTERPVVIVDIDEASLDRFGQWPWPRDLVARLIEGITRAGGVGIGLDVVFAEPDRTSPDLVAARLAGLSGTTLDEIRGARNHDAILAEALAASRVVLGESALVGDSRTPDLSAVPAASFATLGADPGPFLFEFPTLLPNIAPLEKAAAGRGMFTIKPDSDGVVRRVPLVMKAGGRTLPALSIELLRVATGQRGILIKADRTGVKSVVIAGVDIPTDRNARLWVHFTPHDAGRFVSAAEVIDGQAGRRLAGKLVLVGTSASGLYDLRPTPLEPAMPGVEAHAQVIENILTRAYLKRPTFVLGAEVVATALVGLAIILLAPILGALPVLALGGVVAAAGAGVAWYAFETEKLLIDVTFPLGSTFAVFALLVFVNYYREERQKRQIRGAFSQYLSPALVEELARDPDRLVLGGETRPMTILFSDVRGFTAISESYRDDPQGLTRLMNRFLTPLSNAIIERRGTIDKYMGDAVMAFWNAPLDDADHAANACAAALAMLEEVDRLNAERRDEAARDGVPFRPLNVGIGIASGVSVVGNMGSDLRFDYSVMGDTVNIASRLEGQTADYRVRAIVGEETAAAVADRFALLELDLIRVKGKAEPVRIFALLGTAGLTRRSDFEGLRGRNGEMLACYRSRRFERALELVAGCREMAGDFAVEGYYDVFRERIQGFLAFPPPPDWDGVYTATSK